MTTFATPDPLLTQLRHIAHAANVPVSISDSAAEVSKKLAKHAPRTLKKVLSDGTLTRPVIDPRTTLAHLSRTVEQPQHQPSDAAWPSLPMTKPDIWPPALQGQPGMSTDLRLTFAQLCHTVEQSQQKAHHCALPGLHTPVVPSPQSRQESTAQPSKRPPGVQVVEGIVHVVDTVINPGPLRKGSFSQLHAAPKAPILLRPDDDQADGTEDSPPSDTVQPSHPTAILGHMIASCGRLDLEMRQIPPVMEEAAAKGVESARLEYLRMHAAGMRVAKQQFLHEQRKLEKKIGKLGHEMEDLETLHSRRNIEVMRLRFVLVKQEMDGMMQDAAMGLLMNQGRGHDKRFNAMQRCLQMMAHTPTLSPTLTVARPVARPCHLPCPFKWPCVPFELAERQSARGMPSRAS